MFNRKKKAAPPPKQPPKVSLKGSENAQGYTEDLSDDVLAKMFFGSGVKVSAQSPDNKK